MYVCVSVRACFMEDTETDSKRQRERNRRKAGYEYVYSDKLKSEI